MVTHMTSLTMYKIIFRQCINPQNCRNYSAQKGLNDSTTTFG